MPKCVTCLLTALEEYRLSALSTAVLRLCDVILTEARTPRLNLYDPDEENSLEIPPRLASRVQIHWRAARYCSPPSFKSLTSARPKSNTFHLDPRADHGVRNSHQHDEQHRGKRYTFSC